MIWNWLAQLAKDRDAKLITTEKDAARLSAPNGARVWRCCPWRRDLRDESGAGCLACADPFRG